MILRMPKMDGVLLHKNQYEERIQNKVKNKGENGLGVNDKKYSED